MFQICKETLIQHFYCIGVPKDTPKSHELTACTKINFDSASADLIADAISKQRLKNFGAMMPGQGCNSSFLFRGWDLSGSEVRRTIGIGLAARRGKRRSRKLSYALLELIRSYNFIPTERFEYQFQSQAMHSLMLLPGKELLDVSRYWTFSEEK